MGIPASKEEYPIVFERSGFVRVNGGASCSKELQGLLRDLASYGRGCVRHTLPRQGATLMEEMRRALESAVDKVLITGDVFEQLGQVDATDQCRSLSWRSRRG